MSQQDTIPQLRKYKTGQCEQEETARKNTHRVQDMQEIHVISSDDETLGDGGRSVRFEQNPGFAGFPSPGNNLSHVSGNTLRSILRSPTMPPLSEESSTSGRGVVGEVGKRSSYDSQLGAVGYDEVEMKTDVQVKRKKEPKEQEAEEMFVTPGEHTIHLTTTLLQTPTQICQVVEIDSTSTTNSQRQQRLQRRCAQQSAPQKFNKTKCSAETSSEFPVSSPSNPQPGANKCLQRPPLLKNTLPNDYFERQMAGVTTLNPQMTLVDKIRDWKCDPELSDVEDVNEFDALFQRNEDNKRKNAIKTRKNKLAVEEGYDFSHFRNVILKNLNAQTASTSMVHLDGRDKPSTSIAAAAAAASQLFRRQEKKMRPQRDQQQQHQQKKKKAQSSTTPGPATSSSPSSHISSDYLAPDDLIKLNEKLKQQQNDIFKLQIHELCRSSSSEGNLCVSSNINPKFTAAKGKIAIPAASMKQPDTNFNSASLWLSRENDSVLRLKRLKPEIDRNKQELVTHDNREPKRLIEMRLDFVAGKKDLNLREKKVEIFKAPPLPTKYVPPSTPPNTPLKSSIEVLKDSFPSNDSALLGGNAGDNTAERQGNSFKELVNSTAGSTQSEGGKYQKLDASLQHYHEDFHQQHEFCSYLGLTGMSTANAVASAVAELARSNIARRSLRVRRQQHNQERSAKKRNQLEALKMKQLRRIRHNQKALKYDIAEMDQLEKSESASESLAYSNIPESRNALQKSRDVFEETNQNSEIKVLYHMATEAKRRIRKMSKNGLQKIRKPMSNTLIPDFKRDNLTINGRSPQTNGLDSTAYGESSEQEGAFSEEHLMIRTDSREGSYTPPTTRFGNKKRNKSQQSDFKHKRNCGLNQSAIQSANTKDVSHSNQFLTSAKKQGRSVVNDLDTQKKLHMKFQEYLKASRLVKPTIYVVESIVSDKKKKDPLDIPQSTAVPEIIDVPELLPVPESVAVPETVAVPQTVAVPEIVSVPGTVADPEIVFAPEVVPESSCKVKRNTFFGLKPVLRNPKDQRNLVATAAVKPKGDTLAPLISIRKNSNGGLHLKHKTKRILRKLLTRYVLDMATKPQQRNRKLFIFKTIKRRSITARSKARKLKKNYSSQNEENNKSELKIPILQEEGSKKADITEKMKATNFSSEIAAESEAQKTSKTSPELPVDTLDGNNVEFPLESLKVYPSTPSPRAESSTESAGAQLITTLYEQQPNVQAAPAKENRFSQELIATADNEIVVVSSTTNCFDEQATTKECSNTIVDDVNSKHKFIIDNNAVDTKDMATQSEPVPLPNAIVQLTPSTRPLRNPLKSANGKVLYSYYELDVLIVVQETLLSFWKHSNLLKILTAPATRKSQQTKHCSNQHQREDESPVLGASLGEWLHLGECKRLNYDYEITSPYPNRICIHNSIPIYVEMRCKELAKEHRDCNLLSLYINIYYYNDEDMTARTHSIQLDSVKSIPASVIFTAITDSRYFVMSWSQENVLGKMRSGLCKYSLTPHLDTLASIREFKSMRHEIYHLECTNDDKLLGFGARQLTIWDHRSGDVLMNYDFDIEIGRNLGSVFYPSLEIGQNSMIIIFQFMQTVATLANENAEHVKLDVQNTADIPSDIIGSDAVGHSEVHVIACSISHVSPSHRLLVRHTLPSPNFRRLTNVINTGEHLLLTAPNNEEIWISCNDPQLMTLVPPQNSQRFYVRGRSQIIELTENSLTIDSVAKHVLKIAASTGKETMPN